MFDRQLNYYAALIFQEEYYAALGLRIPRLCLNRFSEIKETFNKIVDEGIYLDEFVDILYPDEGGHLISDSFWTASKLKSLKMCLEILGIKIPKTYQEAIYGIIRYHLFNLIENGHPFSGLIAIKEDIPILSDNHDNQFETFFHEKRFSDITCRIGYMIDIYDALYKSDRFYLYEEHGFFNYNGLKDAAGYEALMNDIVSVSQRWLDHHV